MLMSLHRTAPPLHEVKQTQKQNKQTHKKPHTNKHTKVSVQQCMLYKLDRKLGIVIGNKEPE